MSEPILAEIYSQIIDALKCSADYVDTIISNKKNRKKIE